MKKLLNRHLALVVLVALLLIFFAQKAIAVQLTPGQCKALAQWVQGVADVRDLGVDREKHLAFLLNANSEIPVEMQALLKREFQNLYDQPTVPPLLLAQEVYSRCVRSKGDMGTAL